MEKTVLIIDDDPILAETLKAYFSARGASKCRVESNGSSAMKVVDELGDELALITCDLNMAECDGVEFLQFLKDCNCQVPVVIITSATEQVAKSANVLAKAFGLNYLGLIKKPIVARSLDDTLGSVGFTAT